MKDLFVLLVIVVLLLVVSVVLVRSEKFEATPPAGYKFIASDSKKFSKFLKSFINDKKYMVDGENM
jgi:preprotein translocase subunit SecG